jgi:hypothetical protein
MMMSTARILDIPILEIQIHAQKMCQELQNTSRKNFGNAIDGYECL